MTIKDRIRKILPDKVVLLVSSFRKEKFNKRSLLDWERKGRPTPPPHYFKQLIIKEYQKKFNLQVLVETGTFQGEMVEAQRKFFKRIISIELDRVLFLSAQHRFENYTNIQILQGDSGLVLRQVVPTLSERALFWLDGHYSGGNTAKGTKECPILEELDSILKSRYHHVILIDDARLFVGDHGYPTISELSHLLVQFNAKWKVEVRDDVIRCYIN